MKVKEQLTIWLEFLELDGSLKLYFTINMSPVEAGFIGDHATQHSSTFLVSTVQTDDDLTKFTPTLTRLLIDISRIVVTQ